jgi:hypothetical protein
MRVASDLEILRQRFEEWSAIHEIEEKNHRQKVLMALQQLLSPSPIRQPMHLPAGNLQPAPPWARCVYVDNTSNSTSTIITLGFVNFVVPAAAGEWLVVAGSDAIGSTESVNLLFSSDVHDAAASGSEIVQVNGSLPAGTNNIGSSNILLAPNGNTSLQWTQSSVNNNAQGGPGIGMITPYLRDFSSAYYVQASIPGSTGIAATPFSGLYSAAITTATTTSIKASAGVVGSISNASGAATGSITVYDSTTNSGKTIWSGTLAAGEILSIGMPCGTGITVVTAAADAIAVSYA